MYIKPGTAFKDLVILIALIFLLSLLAQRLNKYVSLNKKSLVHELDASFFETIKTMQRHAGVAYQAVRAHTVASEDAVLKRTIKTINRLLDEIETKYTHNAASLAFLGPIGTASIVLKEKRINEQLMTLAFAINDVFTTLLQKPSLSNEKKKTIGLEDLMQLNSMYAKEMKRIL
jgi:hypothetical protein